jgi:hypothetical protein
MKEKKSSKKKLQGYPHYPAGEDIMSGKGEERVDVNLDELSRQQPSSSLKTTPPSVKEKDSSPEIVPGTEADVNADDLQALGLDEGIQADADDEILLQKLRTGSPLTGDDLDVPGSELDDEMEDTGSEDEENNYYSRGQE